MEFMTRELRDEIDIFWSDADDAYVANVPELLYCSAWGETYEEALAEAQVAIRGHLSVLRELGRPVPVRGPTYVAGLRTGRRYEINATGVLFPRT